MQTSYNGVTQPLRSTIDAAAGGTLMKKIEDEAYNLIEEMARNNFQWSSKRTQPNRVGCKLELDVIFMLSSKVNVMSQKLESFNVNSVSSSTPSLSCDMCGSINHLTVHCQVSSPFAQDVSDRVNYVNNYNSRPATYPFSSTYNLGWRNRPNFSYRSNAPFVPQTNFRPPPRFQRPSYPQQTPQKFNLETMMENMLLGQ